MTRQILHLALALALAAPAAADRAPADDGGAEPWPATAGGVFTETVDVGVVNVEVFVTDGDGEPVSGLSPADFAVYEDRRPVAVTYFYAVESGRPRLAGEVIAGLVEPTAAIPAAATAARRAPPPDQRLHLVLFIDNLNITPSQRNRVLEELRRFVAEDLEPGDRAMLVSFDGPSLRIAQGFTEDRRQLAAAIDALTRETSMNAAAAELERRSILREIEGAQYPVQRSENSSTVALQRPSAVVSEASAIVGKIQAYAQRHHHQTFVTLRALSEFVDSLAGLPGRKVVVYVSEGLSLRPGEALYRAWEAKFSPLRELGNNPEEYREITGLLKTAATAAAELNVERAFQTLGRHASSHRVTFYGLRPTGTFHLSAQDGSFDFSALDTPGGGQAWSAATSSIESANRGGSVRDLAEATGGFAITRAGRFGVALERLRRDLGSYYSLGYSPERPLDGERHKIEVRLRDRRLRVRHRESYRDQTRHQRMQARTRAALVYEEGENPLSVSVDVLAGRRDESGHQRLPVMIRVPISNLVLVPREGSYHGQVSFFVGARDSEGNLSPIRTVQVPIRISADDLEQASGRTAGHRFLLEMRADEHTIAVGVRDDLGGVESTTWFEQPALAES